MVTKRKPGAKMGRPKKPRALRQNAGNLWCLTAFASSAGNAGIALDDWILLDHSRRPLARLWKITDGPQDGKWLWTILVRPDGSRGKGETGFAASDFEGREACEMRIPPQRRPKNPLRTNPLQYLYAQVQFFIDYHTRMGTGVSANTIAGNVIAGHYGRPIGENYVYTDPHWLPSGLKGGVKQDAERHRDRNVIRPYADDVLRNLRIFS